ncbi:MAG: hypothetical protein R2695_20205 [Acidimicrobiales bacterium]
MVNRRACITHLLHGGIAAVVLGLSKLRVDHRPAAVRLLPQLSAALGARLHRGPVALGLRRRAARRASSGAAGLLAAAIGAVVVATVAVSASQLVVGGVDAAVRRRRVRIVLVPWFASAPVAATGQDRAATRTAWW